MAFKVTNRGDVDKYKDTKASLYGDDTCYYYYSIKPVVRHNRNGITKVFHVAQAAGYPLTVLILTSPSEYGGFPCPRVTSKVVAVTTITNPTSKQTRALKQRIQDAEAQPDAILHRVMLQQSKSLRKAQEHNYSNKPKAIRNKHGDPSLAGSRLVPSRYVQVPSSTIDMASGSAPIVVLFRTGR